MHIHFLIATFPCVQQTWGSSGKTQEASVHFPIEIQVSCSFKEENLKSHLDDSSWCTCMLSRFIGSNSLQPYCLQPARLLCRRSQMSKRLRIQVGRQSSMVGLWPHPQKFWSTGLGLGPEAASLKSSQNDPNAGGQPHPPEEVLWRAAWRFPHSRSTECISDIIELDVSGTDTSQQICMSHSKNLRDILKLPYRPCVGG